MTTFEFPTLPTAHFAQLSSGYHAVGDRTWAADDFLEANLDSSRALFTPESLAARRPRPKPLEVYALLAGLPFETDFVDRLVATQAEIGAVLGDRMHYWVAPANLGVEYAVFKWPADSWDPAWLPVIRDVVAGIDEPAFRYEIGGVQVNPDGCVVAKGFDAGGTMFRVRERLRREIPFLPQRQSGWAHVPLGRILEPLGAARFARLRELFAAREDMPIATTTIDAMRLIHETRWYMEERTLLQAYPLGMPGRAEGA